MKISENTKISVLIAEDEGVIEVIASINKHFRKLRNPLLRKILAPRVSIADASRIGGVPVCVMIDKLKDFGFDLESGCICNNENEKDEHEQIKNKRIMRKEIIIDLDVRPILDGGTDPFETIMAKLKTLNDGDTLRIINTFEPIPLLNILAKKGYDYETERPEKGVVYTYLEKAGQRQADTEDVAGEDPVQDFDSVFEKFTGRVKEIDVRHLEMPMPMVTILEELEQLDADMALFVNHKRLPQYLLPELKDRNFKWASKEIDEGDLKLIIFK